MDANRCWRQAASERLRGRRRRIANLRRRAIPKFANSAAPVSVTCRSSKRRIRHSADFYRDQYTTLPDTDDRILATLLTAEWTYAAARSRLECATWANSPAVARSLCRAQVARRAAHAL